MRDTKKVIRIVRIVFWTYMIIATLILMINGINDGNISYNPAEFENSKVLLYIFLSLSYLLIFFIYMLIAFMSNSIIVALYVITRIILKNIKNDKLEELNVREKEYYRDILKNNSSAVLDYVSHLTVDTKTVIVVLLSLINKKKIEINDDIKIIDNNVENLDESEKYIFERIHNNKLSLKDIKWDKFISIVHTEANNNGLVGYRDIKSKFKSKLIICIIIGILNYALIIFINKFQLFMNLPLLNISFSIYSFIASGYVMYAILYLIIYYIYLVGNQYKLNDNGKEINKKLVGLKRFIHDFSLLSEKDKEEITLWDEYIIYSVMLDENDKIYEDLLMKIND